MTWLKKVVPPKIQPTELPRTSIPEGIWCKCASCDTVLYTADWDRNWHVCPFCAHHSRLSAREYIKLLFGESSAILEIGAEVLPIDPLSFYDQKSYQERLQQSCEKSGEQEALIVVHGCLQGRAIVLLVFEFGFMGGSMGSVVGERFVRGIRYAIEHGLPVVCVTASGGARMQEGVFSLMQMAKTTAVLTKLAQVPLPLITILTNPTMGGVSASFVFLSDIVLAEPGALIGFAGPRVIAQTVREALPEGFQRAEFLLKRGAIDMLVDRRQLRVRITYLLDILT